MVDYEKYLRQVATDSYWDDEEELDVVEKFRAEFDNLFAQDENYDEMLCWELKTSVEESIKSRRESIVATREHLPLEQQRRAQETKRIAELKVRALLDLLLERKFTDLKQLATFVADGANPVSKKR